MANNEEKKKKKCPTPKKREIQNKKRNLINRTFKSEARTTLNHFEAALKAQDKEAIASSCSSVYSMMDKGVKRKLFSTHKASRIKAKAAAKVAAQAS